MVLSPRIEGFVAELLERPALRRVQRFVQQEALLPSMRGTGIPQLTSEGRLPPGIWQASLGEALTRFGTGSARREELAAQLRELAPQLRAHGIDEIELWGSFPSAKVHPGDVDFSVVRAQGVAHPGLSDLLGRLRRSSDLHEFGALRRFQTSVRDSDAVAGTLLVRL